MVDLVIRGGVVVTPAATSRADIAVDGGRIVAVGETVEHGRQEIDAEGLVVLPGVVDTHVHFNEPGRTDWEGARTGSQALAAGGGTTFVDMPLNSSPCTITPADFDLKRQALEASSVLDFGLWGGLVPGSVGAMPSMVERGVVGFKAFMCDSGLAEFPAADVETLAAGLHQAARLGAIVAVHAEDDATIRAHARVLRGRDARAFLDARPCDAEVMAIERAAALAEQAQASIHIVHVSSGRGVAAAAEARARGVDITIETCPHYLFFTEADVERLGVVLKCAPPIRTPADREALWNGLLDGRVAFVGSDHSPAPPSMKRDDDFVGSWGGIAGVQSTLAVMLEAGGHERHVALGRIAEWLADAPARRYRLAQKGRVVAGADADLALVEIDTATTLDADALLQRHRTNPYVGSVFHGRVRRTIRRGETVWLDGHIVADGGGRFIRPS